MNWRKILKVFMWTMISVVSFMLLISALLLIFKENIKSYALEEANKYLNKRVQINHIELGVWKTFPNVTLSFDDVLVYSKFDTIQTQDTAIYAQKLDLKFNVVDVFKGKYDVHRIDTRNAVLNLKVLENGSVNYDFLKPSEDSTSTSFEFNLEKINFKNTHFTYDNEATQQFYAGFFHDLGVKGAFNEKQFVLGATTNFDLKTIRNKSLTLVENKTASCDILIQMDQINHVFEIKSADLSINKLPFTVKGKVSNDSLDFYIGSKNLNLVEVTNNFSFQELDVVNKINGKGKVNFELFIKGENESTTTPSINAYFDIIDGSLSDNGFSISNINVNGKYSNDANQGNEQLVLSKVQFFTLNKNFNGNLLITDFDRPHLKGKAVGTVDLKAVHRLFGPFSMDQLSGNVVVNGDFDLRLNRPELDKKDITIYNLNANLELHNISGQASGSEHVIDVKNGKFFIENQYIRAIDLSVASNRSSLNIDGEFDNVADYFRDKGNLKVNTKINGDAFYLDDFISQSQEKSTVKTRMFSDNIEGNLTLSLKNFEFSGHQYTDIKTKMNFGKNQLIFPEFELVNAKTKVKGSLDIIEEQPMYFTFNSTLSSSNVDFKKLLKEWNNFDQSVITSENIEGVAKIDVQLKGDFDLYKEEIVKENLDVNARISMSSGTLSNVETFKDITNSLRNSATKLIISKSTINKFEKKLLNLKFDSFENELTIKKGVITIPNMTIKSNALDINLGGIHTFDNNIDYNFNFRFREIKGGQNSEFGDIIDDGTGFRIYLKMYGSVDSPTFSWDKETQKMQQEERKKQAKKDLKSALKTGFGINKKDSTITTFEPEKHKEDKVIMDFNKEDKNDANQQPEEEKKGFFKKKIDKWKKEKEEDDRQPKFEIE